MIERRVPRVLLIGICGCGAIAIERLVSESAARSPEFRPNDQALTARLVTEELDRRAQPATTALHDELLKAEYNSLREESGQARTGQQSILQWSLAAFAAIVGAGLVLVAQGNQADVRQGLAGAVFLIVFGAALPGFAVAACLSWCGELIRMERVGGYLRGLERALAGLNAPLRWETYISRTVGEGGKQQVGYIGSLAIYAGTITISYSMFFADARAFVYSHSDRWLLGSLSVAAPVAWAMGLILIAVIVQSIRRSGRTMVVYENVRPQMNTPQPRDDFFEKVPIEKKRLLASVRRG